MSGWIKLHRKIATWQWASSPNHMTTFMQLLLRANHKDTKWRTVTIEAGQLLTGRKQLMGWTGLTERQIRKCLDDLESTKEIVRKRSAKYSIITITNWDMYQFDDQLTSSKGPAKVQQRSTSKNVNNVKNEKNVKNTNKQKSKILNASPLSVFFDASDEIQEWLLTGTEAAQKELVSKFSHYVLAEEIKKAYLWQLEKTQRKAGTFLITWMSNKNTSAYTPNQAQKSFSTPSAIQALTPEEITLLKEAGQI